MTNEYIYADGVKTKIAENSFFIVIEPDNISALKDVEECDKITSDIVEKHFGKIGKHRIYRL